MDIRVIAGVEFKPIEPQILGNRTAQNVDDIGENTLLFNLQEEMNDAAEEMANILSAFGRFSKAGRKNDGADNDFVSSMLDEQVDKKMDDLISQVVKLRDSKNLLNFARQFFPNDSDLMLALREMLLSRKLSVQIKNKIKEAIVDLEKFGDRKKILSGINIGRLAKRFRHKNYQKSLSANDLRNIYLSFLELEMPAGFIYKDWVDTYGCENRACLLAFTLSALVADMKANEPGIHFSEFGPLSSKLSDARVLYSLDLLLNNIFENFNFRDQMRNQQLLIVEADIVGLYLTGLIDTEKFKISLKCFSENFMSLLLIKQRATVIQALRNIYSQTPDFIFTCTDNRDVVINYLASLLRKMYEKEKNVGLWKDYYK